MNFLYLKAVHVVFVVTWFSGLFYLCRLNVYHQEAELKIELERLVLQNQFNLMMKRLMYGITWPSAILTIFTGVSLTFQYHQIPSWLWIKLGFILLLFIYHLSLQKLLVLQKKNIQKYSSQQLRLWNEVPTLLLVSIVFLVVVKENLSFVHGILGILALSLGIFTGIKIYKLFRKKKGV